MHRSAGFTLIELMVCLAILAVIIALLPPLLGRARDSAALAEAARSLTASLRETRQQAIATGRAERFAIDLSTGTFRGGEGKVQHLPGGIGLSLVTTADERLNDRSGAILFFPDGSSTGGGLSLVRDTRRHDIQVDWLTGRITLATGTAATGSATP
ncbi:MAG: GspH/FimT family pseudopilin [Alphaproteobacteria bacterium]|nr:GspH/FimT family pseudopilin [Alphaproteobacteria bacterium]